MVNVVHDECRSDCGRPARGRGRSGRRRAGARAVELGAPERALAEADPVAMVYAAGAPLAVVALEPGVEGLRTAAARAVRACRGGGTVAWALDASLPVPVDEQVRALAEGAVIGGYDGRRWRSGEPSARRRALRDLRRRRRPGARGRPRGAHRPLDQRRPRARRRASERRSPRPASPSGPRRFRGSRTEVIDARRGRARRAGRRRRQQPDRAAADRPAARAARRAGRAAARARRQVRHVRHRRLLPQAAVGHRPPEGRHGRRRRGRRGAGRHRRARAPAVGHGRRCRPARTCSAAPRSGRRTSSRPPPA